MVAFDFEHRSTGLAMRLQGQKGVNLLLGQALLDGFEELLGFGERQAQMLDPFGILPQGDDVRHGFFAVIIGAQDELKFDMHGGLLRLGWWVSDTAILPESADYPQHLHALLCGQLWYPDRHVEGWRTWPYPRPFQALPDRLACLRLPVLLPPPSAARLSWTPRLLALCSRG